MAQEAPSSESTSPTAVTLQRQACGNLGSARPLDGFKHRLAELRIAIEKHETRNVSVQLEGRVDSSSLVIGTFLGPHNGKAHVIVHGREYCCDVTPNLSLETLKRGTRVLMNQ